MTSIVREGSCLCRRVQIQVVGDPMLYQVCHCINCQVFTGTAFMANAFFPAENVKFLSGKECVKAYEDKDTLSGHTVTRSVCSHCGSKVPGNGGHLLPNTIVVPFGIIEGWNKGSQLVPMREAFEAHRWSWVKDLAFKPVPAKL